MTIDPTRLLQQLEPAVRPGASPTRAAGPRPSIESQSFAQLLEIAGRGELASGLEVAVRFDAQPPLNASQLDRLSQAADQAEAAGAARAMLVIDGRHLLLDVADRALIAEVSPAQRSHVLAPVDAVVMAADPAITPSEHEVAARLTAQLAGGRWPNNTARQRNLAQSIEQAPAQRSARPLH